VPGTAPPSLNIVQDFFHCPSELSAKSQQVSDAASGLAGNEHPHLNLNLDLELSITRPTVHASGKEDVVDSEEGESDLSDGKVGYLCRYGDCLSPPLLLLR